MCLLHTIWIFIVLQAGFKLMIEDKTYFAPGVRGLLSPLQSFLDDKNVMEIMVNRPQEVFIERRGEMNRLEMPILTTQYLRRLFTLIANENKQTLSELSPLLSGSLADGSRVQLIIPEAAKFETLSIRKFVVQNVSFDDYAKVGFFNIENTNNLKEELLQKLYHAQQWQDFFTQAILAKKNIIISGATASGKTTFLNSCASVIPLHERLIILEDTYEIKIPHKNIVRLKALKSANNHKHHISMQDLVQASLRLRPDRIIMGEIRGQEIFDFIAACSTGHSGALATIHANSAEGAFIRMAQLYKLNNVPSMSEADISKVLYATIDIVVQLEKNKQSNRLAEVYYRDAR